MKKLFTNNDRTVNASKVLMSKTVGNNKKLVIYKNTKYGEFCNYSMELHTRVDRNNSNSIVITKSKDIEVVSGAMSLMTRNLKENLLKHLSNSVVIQNSNSKHSRMYDSIKELGITLNSKTIYSYNIFNGMTINLSEISINKNNIIDYEIAFLMANGNHVYVIKTANSLVEAIEEFANLKVKLSAIVIDTILNNNDRLDRMIDLSRNSFSYEHLREMVNF